MKVETRSGVKLCFEEVGEGARDGRSKIQDVKEERLKRVCGVLMWESWRCLGNSGGGRRRRPSQPSGSTMEPG